MATTWMKAIHRGGGISAALGRSIDYVDDPGKTNSGELVEGYECDPFTAQSEFLFSKRLYERQTGRDQGNHDVIAYHVRMSFKPGEITARQALELGREFAMRWTRGKHQFVVAAHTNTNNPHVHIIFNSVNLDCTHKFVDFKRSAIALRRVSDQICLEHGLSIIEKPGLSKGYNRTGYLGVDKAPTVRDRLRDVMDSVLPACKDFNGFLAALEEKGVEIKSGKQLAFKLPGCKKFSRQDTLGDDYSAESIIERISGKRTAVTRKNATASVTATSKPNLLIDIEAKMQQGYGAGFERYAKLHNLKQMAQTLIYLQERGLDDYAVLQEKTAAATARFNELSGRIKELEASMTANATLQKHIVNYSKTRQTYIDYRKAGYSKKFGYIPLHGVIELLNQNHQYYLCRATRISD